VQQLGEGPLTEHPVLLLLLVRQTLPQHHLLVQLVKALAVRAEGPAEARLERALAGHDLVHRHRQ
jgi:hypothetical protein